jgi:hypothetical protein
MLRGISRSTISVSCSSKDWQLMATIRAQDYTFVTNNRSDFLVLHGQEPLHAL